MAETRLRPWTPTEEKFANVVIKAMTAANTWVYRLTGGRLGGKFLRGAPVCLLTTTGRRSGEPRTVALLYLEDGRDVIVVASKGGMAKDPLWYRNLEIHPEAKIQVGNVERKVRAVRVSDREKEALWPRLVEMYPDFDDYQGRTTRNIPVIRLTQA